MMSDDGWGDEPVRATPPSSANNPNAQNKAPSQGFPASTPAAAPTSGFGQQGGGFNNAPNSFGAPAGEFNAAAPVKPAVPAAPSQSFAPATSGGFGVVIPQGTAFGGSTGAATTTAGFGQPGGGFNIAPNSIGAPSGGAATPAAGGFNVATAPPAGGFNAPIAATPKPAVPAAPSQSFAPATSGGFGAAISQNSNFGGGSNSFGSKIEPPAAVNNTSSGFGQPSGFGAAASSGFTSVVSAPPANAGGFGAPPSSVSGGFGQSSSGFGQPNTNNVGQSSGGFGGSSGGFGGSSGGFGGSSGGGGFSGGGNSSGGRNCFNCDQPGHRASDCPEPKKPRGGNQSSGGAAPAGFGGTATGFGGASGFGGGFTSGGSGNRFADVAGGGGEERSRACFNCSDEGHRSSECPQPKKPSKCFNCNEEGHMSSDCPLPPKVPKCFNCREERHKTADCTKPPRPCGNCREQGHRTADCPMPKKPARCFNCFADGHYSSECTEPKRMSKCYNCDQDGHRSTECPEPLKPREDGSKPASTFIPTEEATDELYHAGVEKGAMFERFFDAKVITTCGGLDGKQRDSPVYESFAQLNINAKICENIVQSEYTKPTPVQQHAMPLISAGNDVMACAQTGSGKTAAYLLPIMSRLLEGTDFASAEEGGCKPRCLIISPTRELAVQIYNECRKFSNGTDLKCKVAYGGTHVSFQKNHLQVEGADIVVGTIGRLNHFVAEGVISLEKVRFLVLDEADRMMEIGLQEDIRKLTDNPNMPDKTNRQTVMFSATFPTEVQMEARRMLKEDYLMVAVDEIGTANKCITQEVVMMDQQEKKDTLLKMLDIDIKKYMVDKDSEVFKLKTLIFVSKKTFADTLGAIVSSAGVPATTIHGDRLQNERHEAIQDFVVGRKAVLIATAVAERGLDIKGVDHVINYDLPENIDEYVHRIGRTGRVGNSGRATSFYIASKDQALAPGLVKCMELAGQVIPEWLIQESKGAAGSFEVGSGFNNTDVAAGGAPAQEEEW